MFTSIKRTIHLGWQTFSRDGGAVASTCFIMILAISLVTSLFLLREMSRFLIKNLEEKVDISVYFKEDILENEILDVKEELTKTPEVKSVKYISKEQAMAEFIQRHEQDPLLMRSLEEVGLNPFLASLNIKASDPDQYEKITSFLENSIFKDFIEKIDYYQRKSVIERIFALTAYMEKFGLFLSFLLLFLAFSVVLNTIRLAILNSSEEIKIQKLVGAPNWFIRGPFLVQGVLSGVLSALATFLIFSFLCWFFSPKIEFLFPGLNLWQYFTNSLLNIVLIQFGTGILLGEISSIIAIRKYLKV
jgi:cell division transport system permease protein